MSTRTLVITGASDGIGAAAAERLARAHPGDRLLIVGRNPEKTAAVADRVGGEAFTADFAELDQVRALAAQLRAATDRIDVLANNAGGMFPGPTTTADGFELTFQVNHLAPTLLTHELLDVLLASHASVVATASVANLAFGRLDFDDLQSTNRFSPYRAYGSAKLANILFTRALHERYHARGLSTVAYHPGVVMSQFGQTTDTAMAWFYRTRLAHAMFLSPEEGGANLAYFVDGTPSIAWESGGYYNDRHRPGQVWPPARRRDAARRHFAATAQLLGITWPA